MKLRRVLINKETRKSLAVSVPTSCNKNLQYVSLFSRHLLKHSNEKVPFDYRVMYKMSRTAWRKAIRTSGSTVYLLLGEDGSLSGRMDQLYQDKEKVGSEAGTNGREMIEPA